jgi:hypothetical protein
MCREAIVSIDWLTNREYPAEIGHVQAWHGKRRVRRERPAAAIRIPETDYRATVFAISFSLSTHSRSTEASSSAIGLGGIRLRW